MYWLAQTFGFIATAIILTYTLCNVSRKMIMICNIVLNSLWAIHYIILGAYTGAFCSFFTAFMFFCFSFKGKNAFFKGLWMPIIFNICFLAIEIFTWAGLSTVIQMVGNILLIVAMWAEKEIHIKALCIPVGILWCVYNYIFFSWMGLVGQMLAVSCNIIFVIRYLVRKKQNRDTAFTNSES